MFCSVTLARNESRLERNETRLERNETRLERNETRLARNETRLARNETRGGNLHLSGTVAPRKNLFRSLDGLKAGKGRIALSLGCSCRVF